MSNLWSVISVAKGVEALIAALDGRAIDVLVNNAGFGTYGRFPEIDPDRDRDLIAVNVDALVRLTHAVLPGMLERGHGRILNVASTIAFQPGPYQATYGASKAFVLSFSQALWAETRGSGVSVTALCPGPTRDRLCRRAGCRRVGYGDLPEARVTGTRCGRRTSGARSRTAGGGDGSEESDDDHGSRLSPGWVGALISGRMLRPGRHLASPRRGAMITDTGLTAADEAARMVAEVRDDPAGRIRLAADTYAVGRGNRRYRPYRRAVVAFMRWRKARGVLNPLDDGVPAARGGARSTRTCCATPSRRSCWSARRWAPVTAERRALGQLLQGSVGAVVVRGAQRELVAGYLAHAGLAALEAPAERFFMNVVLVRVLYAQALVVDGDLALGRLSFLARLIGHPRSRGPQALLSMKDVLPGRYPIEAPGWRRSSTGRTGSAG